MENDKAKQTKKNLNFVQIHDLLRQLREADLITDAEFKRANEYYRKMTGADIFLVDSFKPKKDISLDL